MALNKQMHPRNPFKNNKPDFKALATKYEHFRKHASIDLKGRVHLDFKKPECLRALSWALLKDLYGVDVDMPLDRLVPTIPLRLNYILWLEDLLQCNPVQTGSDGLPKSGSNQICGLDVGTGASCVYPLIGARKNNWQFIATEADEMNWEFARRNVQKNGLEGQISVLKVSPEDSLLHTVTESAHPIDFCMCNPPFFGSNFEAWGLSSHNRGDDRPEPKSVSTASPAESVFPGGEVEFVRHMISDSHELKQKVRVYTSMLGKKSSLTILKEDLRRTGVPQMCTTEFCQGRTMRWALAWSFDPAVTLSGAVSQQMKPRPPLTYTVPREETEARGLQYSVDALSVRLTTLLQNIQFELIEEVNLNTKKTWQITATQVTWSHQRRQRRQKQRERKGLISEDVKGLSECKDSKVLDSGNSGLQTDKKRKHTDNVDISPETKRLKEDWIDTANDILMKNKEVETEEIKEIIKEGGSDGDTCNVAEKCESTEEAQQSKDDTTATYETKELHEAKGKCETGEETAVCETEGKSETGEKVRMCETKGECQTDEKVGTMQEAGEVISQCEAMDTCKTVETSKAQQNTSGESDSTCKERSCETKEKYEDTRDGSKAEQSAPANHLLSCRLSMYSKEESVVIAMEMIDGQSKELMHQVMQYIKNRLLTEED